MSEISSWILSIAGVICLSVIVELILPEGQMNKYIKGIFSFVVIFIIISPIPTLMKKELNIEKIFGFENSISVDEDYLYQLNYDKVNALKKEILNECEGFGYKNIEMYFNCDISKSEMKIKSITVDLSCLRITENSEHNDISKIKKHIEIYIAIVVALIIIAVYFSTSFAFKSKGQKSSTKEDNLEVNFSNSQEYVVYLENKLESVITNVKGVGQANVIITLEKGFEYVYETEEETNSSANGNIVTKTKVVLVNGKPVLKEEIYPVVKGIVIVAEGAKDTRVKLNILSIVQTIIDINTSQITILEGK